MRVTCQVKWLASKPIVQAAIYRVTAVIKKKKKPTPTPFGNSQTHMCIHVHRWEDEKINSITIPVHPRMDRDGYVHAHRHSDRHAHTYQVSELIPLRQWLRCCSAINEMECCSAQSELYSQVSLPQRQKHVQKHVHHQHQTDAHAPGWASKTHSDSSVWILGALEFCCIQWNIYFVKMCCFVLC